MFIKHSLHAKHMDYCFTCIILQLYPVDTLTIPMTGRKLQAAAPGLLAQDHTACKWYGIPIYLNPKPLA